MKKLDVHFDNQSQIYEEEKHGMALFDDLKTVVQWPSATDVREIKCHFRRNEKLEFGLHVAF